MHLNFLSDIGISLRESGYRIIVTGAGGWLGLATLEMLEDALGSEFDERVVAIASHQRALSLRSGKIIQLIDFAQAQNLDSRPTILVHYAFLTRDKVAQSPLSDYVQLNREITSCALELARRVRAEAAFLISSGAVYEKDRSLCQDLERNPYGFLKVEEEGRFIEFSETNNSRLSLCRLFNLSGPFIHKEFALNSILLSILDHRDVELLADHEVIRDFIHVRDLISLGFAMMLDRNQSFRQSFDSGIGQPIEIGELASRSLELLGARNLKVLRKKIEGSPNIYIGNATKILSLFKSYDLEAADLDTQIIDTADYLRSC